MKKFILHIIASFTGITKGVWWLALANLINRCGSMVLGFLPIYLTSQLHFSIEKAGIAMSCFGMGAVVGNFLGGILTDKLGSLKVMTLSLVLNGLVLIGMLWVKDFPLMCVTLFVFSISSDLFRPANSSAIAKAANPESLTRSYSLLRLAYNLGWTVAPALGGFIAHHIGWHLLFIVDGITCILAAVFMVTVVAAHVPSVKHIYKKENTVVASATEHAPRNAYTDRLYLYFVLLTVVNAFVFMQILWTLPLYFEKGLGLNEAQVGLLVSLNGVLVTLVEMPLVFSIEHKFNKIKLIRFGLSLYALAYYALNLPLPGVWTAIVFIMGISIGEILVMPFSSNFAVSRAPLAKQGNYMALYSIGYAIANILAPLLGTQLIARVGYPAFFYIIGSLALIDWVGFWWLQRWLRQEKGAVSA